MYVCCVVLINYSVFDKFTNNCLKLANQSRCLSDSLQAAAVRGTVWLHTVYGWKVFTIERTTIQLAERLGLCTSWYQEATHRSQPSATHVSYGVRCRVTSGYDCTDIFCRSWGEGERAVLLRCLAVLADASSNQTCHRTLFIHKKIMLLTAKLVVFLCSVISQGKVVALDRWGGNWNHLSMTPRLITDYAKNYCNRALILKVIAENVVTCFLLGHSV